ncbi:hypothetical protein ACFVGY_32425 [Streptomyces sp. NPDC127106]
MGVTSRVLRTAIAAAVERAEHAGKVCEAEHGPALDVYTRDV